MSTSAAQLETHPPATGRHFGASGGNTYFVNPARLGPNSVVYSGGLGHQIEFERELIHSLGLRIIGVDPTEECAKYMRLKRPEGLTYAQVGLAGHDGEISFVTKKAPSAFYRSLEVVPEGEAHVPLRSPEPEAEPEIASFPVRRLGTLMQHFGHSHIDLLKIDIEGSEYALLDDMATQGIWPDQIALEWHPRFAGRGDREAGLAKTRDYIGRLQAQGYVITNTQRNDTEMSFEKMQGLR